PRIVTLQLEKIDGKQAAALVVCDVIAGACASGAGGAADGGQPVPSVHAQRVEARSEPVADDRGQPRPGRAGDAVVMQVQALSPAVWVSRYRKNGAALEVVGPGIDALGTPHAVLVEHDARQRIGVSRLPLGF